MSCFSSLATAIIITYKATTIIEPYNATFVPIIIIDNIVNSIVTKLLTFLSYVYIPNIIGSSKHNNADN